MSDSICGTCVKIAHVTADICKKVGVTSNLSKWTATEIGAGKGFLSVMAKIEFCWEDSNPQLPKSLIAKIPTIDKLKMVIPEDQKPMLEAIKKELFNIHNCEISVYEVLGDNTSIGLPKLWGSRLLAEDGLEKKESAYILMEDLSADCTHWDMMTGEKLNEVQAKKVLQALANFHSWSIINPSEAAKIKGFDTKEMAEKMSDGFAPAMTQLKEALQTKKWIDALGEIMARKNVFLEMTNDDVEDLMAKTHLQHQVSTTLVHGDVHCNNMLFVKGPNGKPSDQLKALIDWQCVNQGNPLFDVCRVINWLGPLSHRSKTARVQLLQVYFDQFSANMKTANEAMQFNFDQLQSAYWATSIGFGKWFLLFFGGILSKLESGAVPGIDNLEDAAKKMMNDLVWAYKDVISILDGNMDSL